MTEPDFQLIGRGIYTVPEAARLTGIEARTIRRWLLGYAVRLRGERRASPPVLMSDYPLIDAVPTMSFLDLQEIRFVEAFRRRGVSWKTIRDTYEQAQGILSSRHPFATGRFLTDGRNLLLDSTAPQRRDSALLNILKKQLEFRRIVAPFLKELDFDNKNQAARWWPSVGRRRIVIDPERSFGQAVVDREGVPTVILASAYAVEKSIEAVVRWYEVSTASVRAAVEFEEQLAA